MNNQLEGTVKSCDIFKMADKLVKLSTPPLQALDFPDKCKKKVVVDIVGPIEQAQQNCRFAITLINYFSNFPKVHFTAHVTISTVPSFLHVVLSHDG